jgi:hypothetical protein
MTLFNENFRLMMSKEEKVPFKGEDISPDKDEGINICMEYIILDSYVY